MTTESDNIHGTVTVISNFREGKVAKEGETKSRVIQLRFPEGVPLAKVSTSYGLTLSTGIPYEFARIDASVTLPCHIDETEEAFKAAWDIARDEIKTQAESVMKFRDNRKKG